MCLMVTPQKVYEYEGGSVDVICTVNLATSRGRDSRHLYFEATNKRIPQNQIEILNSTSIKWHLDNATINDTKRYQCLLDGDPKGEGIGITNLYIGYYPIEITDFKCRSPNWQNMTCQFTKPWNPLLTQYSLSFVTDVFNRYRYDCNLTTVDSLMKCNLNYAAYRQSHEYFNFTLVISHELASITQQFHVENMRTIVPAPVQIENKFNETSRSATVRWQLDARLALLPKLQHVYFVHDVRILSEFDKKNNNETVWKKIDPRRVQAESMDENNPILWFHVKLHDLEYANAWYEVRIRVRTDHAEDIDEMYSEVVTMPFHTLSRTPDRPPLTDQGAFFINDDNDIYIFWEELAKSELNGPNASYVITEVRENGNLIKRDPIDIKSTFAKFTRTNERVNYEFIVKSQNSLGQSMHGSTIRIPPKTKRLPHPVNLKKISQDGVYHLSWQAPHATTTSGLSYTVFWCKPLNSLPNACDGEFHFARVEHPVTSFSLRQNGSINFGVSTNDKLSSSGMVWAMCTAAQSSDIGKIKTIWITQLDSNHMELQWKLDCMYDSIVKGYVIKFCPIKDPKTLECKDESLKNITINQPANNFTITGLKPYTTYKIVLSMFSATRHGPDSDPLQNTTLEAKPSPPVDFKAYDVRNTSMKLEWKRPRHSNGVLMYYRIFYNGNRIDVYNVTNDTTKEPYEKMTYFLQNLTSFTNYELLIKACNQFCSENSNKDNKTTEIGVPGSMIQASSTANEIGMIEVNWVPPIIKSGHINYYELRSVSKYRGKVMFDSVIRIESKHLSCRRSSPCEPNIDTVEYYVRAVNVIRSPHAVDDTQVTQKYTTTNDNRVDVDLTTKHPGRHAHHEGPHHQNCEMQDKDFIRWLESDRYSDHLKGEWSKPSTTNCMHYGGIDIKTIVTIICSLFLMATMLGVGYKFYQKIKYMKNIVIILPTGLEDITKETRPENLENGGMKKLSNKPDIIMDNLGSIGEEEDRLLTKRTDRDSNSGQSSSDDSHSTAEAHDDCLEDQAYDVQGLIDDGSQSSNNSMSMDNEFEPTKQPSFTEQFVPGHATSTPQPPMSYPPIMTSGYVKPNSILRPNASGYVQHTALPSVRPTPTTTNNGYVPYNQIGRPTEQTDLTNIKMGVKTPIVASTDANGISGYVTHKQLSDFGHRMQ